MHLRFINSQIMSSESQHSREISETADNLTIRDALKETLGKAQAAGIELYLTGGTAAAVYAGETRPLSLDLDFFVDPANKAKIQETFGGEFVYFGKKALFKSDKLVGKSENGVDLDFIAEQNIVPSESNPEDKITLSLSSFAKEHHREEEFMGEKVKVLPPELIVIAKLFAGRGIELNKYDLSDSEGVLESGIVRTDMVIKAINEIGGENPTVYQLLAERLKTALKKLKQTPRVVELLSAMEELQNPTGRPHSNVDTGEAAAIKIKNIAEATRQITIGDTIGVIK